MKSAVLLTQSVCIFGNTLILLLLHLKDLQGYKYMIDVWV